MTEYQSSTSEYASLYGVDHSTIRRWKYKGAPLDDPEAMRVFRVNEKARTGVSKSNHRRTGSPQTSPQRLRARTRARAHQPRARVHARPISQSP